MSTPISNPVEIPDEQGPEPSASTEIVPAAIAPTAPPDQLSQMPRLELEHLAEDLGLDFTVFRTPQLLVAAIHERRQLIASLDRDSMMDVIRWGRRAVPINAGKEQLASEISRIKSMR